ncbi:MAG TPA: HgcAB-associated protein [Spirochaetota bacterium]|nr:HgcAB-associated protein [Spirochaetota bacterium]
MKKGNAACCDPRPGGRYSVESIVSVDERGQMVLPRDVREALGIASGGKLALVVMEREGSPCCVTLFKSDELSGMVQNMLGPAAEYGSRK